MDFQIKRQEVEPITAITIGDKEYKVDEMGDNVKQLVAMFNRLNESEADANYKVALLSEEITTFQMAKDTLSRQILSLVKEETNEQERGAENG